MSYWCQNYQIFTYKNTTKLVKLSLTVYKELLEALKTLKALKHLNYNVLYQIKNESKKTTTLLMEDDSYSDWFSKKR